MRGSNKDLRVFLSSTVFDLIDLREELANSLRKFGVKPILSNDNDFPEDTPASKPWETCLQELEDCPVVILIVGLRYGASLEFSDGYPSIGNQKLSATHAEYRHAVAKEKKIMIYYRNELVQYYNVWKETRKSSVNIQSVLPDYVEAGVLDFFHELKNSGHWMKGFTTSVDLRKSVQHRLINSLYEYYRDRASNFDAERKLIEKSVNAAGVYQEVFNEVIKMSDVFKSWKMGEKEEDHTLFSNVDADESTKIHSSGSIGDKEGKKPRSRISDATVGSSVIRSEKGKFLPMIRQIEEEIASNVIRHYRNEIKYATLSPLVSEAGYDFMIELNSGNRLLGEIVFSVRDPRLLFARIKRIKPELKLGDSIVICLNTTSRSKVIEKSIEMLRQDPEVGEIVLFKLDDTTPTIVDYNAKNQKI